jgi:hypothetical protein
MVDAGGHLSQHRELGGLNQLILGFAMLGYFLLQPRIGQGEILGTLLNPAFKLLLRPLQLNLLLFAFGNVMDGYDKLTLAIGRHAAKGQFNGEQRMIGTQR